MDAAYLGVIISGTVGIAGIGATYGILRASLTSLQQRIVELIAEQSETNKRLWLQMSNIDQRMNNHVEKFHTKVPTHEH